MKKVSFLISALMGITLLTGCEQKKESPAVISQDTANVSVADTAKAVVTNTKNSQTANEIRQFVSNTYTEVFAVYKQEHLNEGNGPDRSVFDKKFLSKRLQKAIDIEEMIDVDYWIHAQDFTTPVFKIMDVHVTDEKSGWADMEIRVFGPDTSDTDASYSRVQVKVEDGKWKIDDFQYRHEDGHYTGWE